MMLSVAESALLDACFRETTEGPYFPDWEFPTLFGATRDKVRASRRHWATGKMDGQDHHVASQVLTNLISYPHGLAKQLGDTVGGSVDELSKLRDKLMAGAE
jgi:hypothetical protein